MDTKTKMQTEKKRKRKFTLISVGILIFAFLALWLLGVLNEPTMETKNEEILPSVSVIEVKPSSHRAAISSLSEAKARNTAVLRTQVGGEIEQISEEFLPGVLVKKGAILLKTNDNAQKTLVAESANRLARAELELLKEERTADTAEKSWELYDKRSETPSPLLLRKPQIKSAKAERKASVAALNEAENRLKNTTVRAPFNGVIEGRSVSLGETIDVGQEVGTIVDQDTIDLTVHLKNSDWMLLPNVALGSIEVTLLEPVSGNTWPAKIRAKGSVVDQSTRLRKLFVVHIRDPSQNDPLLPGTFVKVTIEGKEVDNLLKLPESALTRNGEIWLVDEENRLARHPVSLIFSREGYVFVTNPLDGNKPLRVAVNPLASFVVGDRVDIKKYKEKK